MWNQTVWSGVVPAVVALTACNKAGLFEACSTDDDCEEPWECVSGPAGSLCTDECIGVDDCRFTVDGDRDANRCLQDTCYQMCPSEGGGCSDLGLSPYRVYEPDIGVSVCVCGPST